jgi:hypothetical protein
VQLRNDLALIAVILLADRSIDCSAELANTGAFINVTLEPNVTEVGTSTVYANSCPL